MPASKVPLRAFVTDVVAIVLDEKLAVDPAPLADSVVAQSGLRLVHAAYPADEPKSRAADFTVHDLVALALAEQICAERTCRTLRA